MATETKVTHPFPVDLEFQAMQALWQGWDPMGVFRLEHAVIADEYDEHARESIRMNAQGADLEQMKAHLESAVVGAMGMKRAFFLSLEPEEFARKVMALGNKGL